MLRHDVRTCGITARARGQIFFGNLQKKDLSTAYMLGSNFLEALDMDIFGAKSRAAAKRKNEATAAAIAMMKEIAAEGCHLPTQANEIAQFKMNLEEAKRYDEDDF